MIDQLPAGPNPAVDPPGEFSKKAAASVLAQMAMIDQINAALATLSSFAAGGAFAIPFRVDTSSTAAGDPGPEKIRFNNSNQNAATALYLDPVAFGGADVTAKLDQFGSSTSTVKGVLRMVQLNDLARELVFNVTAVASPTGYRTLTVVPVSSSAASPFASGATVLLHFDRTGDKGDTGPMNVYPYAQFTEQYASGTAGGPTGTGVVDRALNTVVSNDITGVSLASGVVTVTAAGRYEFRAASTVAGNASTSNRAILHNTTDNVVVASGMSQIGGSNENTVSHVSGRFTISAGQQKSFRLRTHIGLVASTWGTPAGGGYRDSFALMVFWELS